MQWSLRIVAGVGLVCGCAFDSIAEGGAPGGVGMDETTGASGGPPLSTTKGSGQGATADGVGSSGELGPGAHLRFAGFDAHDFGNVAPGGQDGAVLIIANEGDATATAITPAALAGPFAFQGGDYPGAGGTCGGTLDAGQRCDLALAFAPEAFGSWQSELVLDYEGGGEPAAVQLSGVSVGHSENLVINGDAETGGMPPIGWQNVAGAWLTETSMADAHSGTRYIFGGPLMGNGTVELRQTLPLTPYAPLIDNGELEYIFRGFTRALEQGDDPHQVLLRFLGEGGAELDVADLGRHAQGGWALLEDANPIPANARSVAIELQCHKLTGDFCSAMFDDLTFVVSYTVPP